MAFDGFVAGGTKFGGVGVGEPRPTGKVASLDGSKPGGLDGEAGGSVEVVDQRADAGQVMRIEGCWRERWWRWQDVVRWD